jgi:hypothetical protein
LLVDSFNEPVPSVSCTTVGDDNAGADHDNPAVAVPDVEVAANAAPTGTQVATAVIAATIELFVRVRRVLPVIRPPDVLSAIWPDGLAIGWRNGGFKALR